MMKPSDIHMLANDSFESMRIQYVSEDEFINKFIHYIAIYLKTGDNVGLTPESKRLIDGLINYAKYQLETRTQSVSTILPKDSPPYR